MTKTIPDTHAINYSQLAEKIQCWGKELGFSQLGITDIDLSQHERSLEKWLANGYHGNMEYMARHGLMRARPAELVPGTVRVISVRLDYLPTDAKCARILKAKDHAYISRYALGRDYHKLMRKRLQSLGKKIAEHCEEFNFRPFVDSAPILERPLAEKAGLGWVGKHTLLLNKEAGSWFFLGELLIDIPLPITSIKPKNTERSVNDCGSCVACIKICPTKAIVEPYVVDARRCISYFTIESPDPIPIELRPLMGNRIYGCDDCQLICPWNKYAKLSLEDDFQARNQLDEITLLTLFSWNETYFLDVFQGSPIRRIGFQSWQRNIAVALGNAPWDAEIVQALEDKLPLASELVAEHIHWAIAQQNLSKPNKDVMNKSPIERLNARLIRSVEKGLPRDA
ncbi:tRNA epoxyqueuosine(34) reductase QueG [Colwellia sp. 1_MG-2023]|jgi:epoxyqueuosine reductase|uniref:tRNA epoxyqueuosine(34) reductase QueG n=1 Tax=unclassified Colwellia TaxID=196834 RepID=UPI001C098AB4|nr:MULTISPECIES: tRNA epoxyqueuosine(34) reductase QueG [unclassified Colwellia]MBU2925930.1 tRNA epoxyqueuosine(34) reductase QueG [Colwellia sp. C2M11]MDO6488498.1 tRNA epoxyqueuosine(34) reductase QueG [Colwellia sp. 6_MG-2023]MDO6652672.1 tRNA epoxyqueuosine(34) reductase QueG [Colwellia sp. 3_MG-2023]MDO6665547.1 tRNA epoxyqueuosine(34) reductase QueG [Colwellia sp. 2_MG-2023]MDO6689920.1 tRNA epoxyqueuosine(34) reductase QueG [Colwellia sp. 1_MG-2023]